MSPSIQDLCQIQVAETIERLGPKYQERWYVPRAAAERSFNQFFLGGKKLFLVLGDSGTGKTNLLCHLAQDSVTQRPTMFVAGMWNWSRDLSIWQYLLAPLYRAAAPEMVFERWLALLTDSIRGSKQDLLIFADGINETDDPERVKRGLRTALETGPPQVRLVLSARVDSFRLHYRDSFWKDHMHQDHGDGAETLVPPRFEAMMTERYQRTISPEHRQDLEVAIARYRAELRRRQLELARHQAIDASVLLGDFNEMEFHHAVAKYAVKATLVGNAREVCHNPLMFRFFAETEGKEAREVAEVFTVDTCQSYLNLRVTEAMSRPPCPSHEEVVEFLFSLARACRAERGELSLRNRQEAALQGAHAPALTESLVESGLLVWRSGTGDPEQRRPAFSFDRILSYVLALEAARGGPERATRQLRWIVGRSTLLEIDIHQAAYLLLFLDEQESAGRPARRPVGYWVRRCLKSRVVQREIIRTLPELKTWSVPDVVAELKGILLHEAGHETRGRDGLVSDCAAALATLAQRGNGSAVMELIAEVLRPLLASKKREAFFDLVRPIAVAFPVAPQPGMRLLETLCEIEVESGLRLSILDSYVENSARGGLAILKDEIVSFPSARRDLVEALSRSRYPVFRSLAACALPRLAVWDQKTVVELVRRLTDDNDNIVRADLARLLYDIGSLDYATTMDLATRLWKDRDTKVRAGLAVAAVELFRAERTEADALLKGLIADESPAVRIGVGGALASAVVEEQDEGRRKLLVELLQLLVRDSSSGVRLGVVKAMFERWGPRKDRSLALQLLLHALGDDAARGLKKELAACLDRSDLGEWPLVTVEGVVHEIAAAFVDDEDDEVREKAIPLVWSMVEQGAEGGQALAARLMNDPKVDVRLKLLASYAQKPVSSMAAVLSRDDGEPTSPRAAERAVADWAVLFTEARVSGLDWRGRVTRFFGLLTATALIYPLLLAIGARRNELWPAEALSGFALFDPRLSAMPMALGVLVAVLLYGVGCGLDVHFCSRHLGTVLRNQWRALVATIALGPMTGLVAAALTTRETAVLIGIAAVCSGALVVFAAAPRFERGAMISTDVKHFSPSKPLCVLGAGIASGSVAGLASASTTVELYYPLVLLLCAVMLAVPPRPAIWDHLASGIAGGLLVGVLLPFGRAASAWMDLSESKLLQALAPFLGEPTSAPVLAVTFVLVGFSVVYLVFTSEEDHILTSILAAGAILLVAMVFSLHRPTSFHVSLLAFSLPALVRLFSQSLLSSDVINWIATLLVMLVVTSSIASFEMRSGVSVWWLVALSTLSGLLWAVIGMPRGPALWEGPFARFWRLGAARLQDQFPSRRIALITAFAAAPTFHWLVETGYRLSSVLVSGAPGRDVEPLTLTIAAAVLGSTTASVPLAIRVDWRWRRGAFYAAAGVVLGVAVVALRWNPATAVLSAGVTAAGLAWLFGVVAHRGNRTACWLLLASVLLPIGLVAVSISTGSRWAAYAVVFVVVWSFLKAVERLEPGVWEAVVADLRR